MDRLRTVAELQYESVNLVTTDDSGIRALEDLKGKRVAYDRHGATVLAAAGINVKTDLQGRELDAQPAAQALVKKEVDAAFITQAHPSQLLKDLVASDQKIRLVPVPATDKLMQGRPYYREFRVPISNYPGIVNDADTPTIAVRLAMVTAVDVHEAAVYEMAKLLAKDLVNLRAGSPTLFYVNEKDLGKSPVLPLHPGAQRALKEAGALEGA
jgi:TRAP transporter TAXI family solute receptor